MVVKVVFETSEDLQEEAVKQDLIEYISDEIEVSRIEVTIEKETSNAHFENQ